MVPVKSKGIGGDSCSPRCVITVVYLVIRSSEFWYLTVLYQVYLSSPAPEAEPEGREGFRRKEEKRRVKWILSLVGRLERAVRRRERPM